MMKKGQKSSVSKLQEIVDGISEITERPVAKHEHVQEGMIEF